MTKAFGLRVNLEILRMTSYLVHGVMLAVGWISDDRIVLTVYKLWVKNFALISWCILFVIIKISGN